MKIETKKYLAREMLKRLYSGETLSRAAQTWLAEEFAAALRRDDSERTNKTGEADKICNNFGEKRRIASLLASSCKPSG